MVCDVPPISSSGLAEIFEASLHEIIRAPSIYRYTDIPDKGWLEAGRPILNWQRLRR